MVGPDDPELLRRVAAGEDEALRLLYQRHAGWLLLRLQRRCASAELVESALQDTFVTVWRSAGSFRGEGEVGAWLWGIAVRRLVSALRGRPAPGPVSHDELDRVSPVVASAEDELLLGIAHGDLGWALGTLGAELRATVQATLIDGLTTKEAAQLLGIPHGTVKTRLRTAKAQLRQRLMPLREGRTS